MITRKSFTAFILAALFFYISYVFGNIATKLTSGMIGWFVIMSLLSGLVGVIWLVVTGYIIYDDSEKKDKE